MRLQWKGFERAHELPKFLQAFNDFLNTQLAEWARALSQKPWETVVKASHEDRSADTTLTADATLARRLAPHAAYAIRALIAFDTVAAADFQWQLTGPAGAEVRVVARAVAPGGTAFAAIVVQDDWAQPQAVTGTGTTGGMVLLEGAILTAGAGGPVAIAWAQNTSDAGTTTVRAGSYLEVARQ